MTDRAAYAIRWCTGDRDDPQAYPWRQNTSLDKREQRRRLWLYAEPKRCERLIKALRWAWWNRVELLMLALCFFAVIGAEWFARILLQQVL